jgi:16S rRNA (cytidine(1402)-2'-O)-methyltransferase
MISGSTGKLYLVPTPIGNLEDMTLRAIRVLKEAQLVLCEDTRRAAILFQKYNLLTPKDSYHEHNKFSKTPGILDRIKRGEVIAQISEAGTPGISDPGFYLARGLRLKFSRAPARRLWRWWDRDCRRIDLYLRDSYPPRRAEKPAWNF